MSMQHRLPEAPLTIERFHEIATRYNPELPSLFNTLTSQERVFIYYLFRACLPGNEIAADQLHRYAPYMIQLCEELIKESDRIKRLWTLAEPVDLFMSQLLIYATYLWSGHSHYFLKEHVNEKRTPARLGLDLITIDTIVYARSLLEQPFDKEELNTVLSSVFDSGRELTNCVANDISSSAGNYYSADFTEEDYMALPASERVHLNAYYYIEHIDGQRVPRVQRYKIGGRYSKELSIAAYWLTKARDHANDYPQQFDNAMIESLSSLIDFLYSGDERDFRKHSISWIKTNNRIDYVFGFIENYQDPKETRGMFEAEVTIKVIDMASLNRLLPVLEDQLPFDHEFKRGGLSDGSAAMPNASINATVFGSGHSGPLQIVAAYCLPNYEDIRSEYGSKQVIYQSGKGLGSLLNPKLYRTLFYPTPQVTFLEQHDPSGSLHGDIWNVHCILHETLGHGSGKLARHTFVEGDPLIIEDRQYALGDTLELSPDTLNLFFAGTGQALEELRAEIIALYTSIFMFDELSAQGLYKDWPERIGKDAMIDWLIYDMAFTGLRRLQSQPIGVNEISGAHAQANTILMNYLIDHGGLDLVDECKQVNGEEFHVLGFSLTDKNKVLETIRRLAIEVQRIKSTGDGQSFNVLLNTYGKYVRNPEYVGYLQRAMKEVTGELKVSASIYPRLEPVRDTQGNIIDISASWPESFLKQHFEHSLLRASKE